MSLFALDYASYRILQSASSSPVTWLTDSSVTFKTAPTTKPDEATSALPESNAQPGRIPDGASPTLGSAIRELIEHKTRRVTVRKSPAPTSDGTAFWTSGAPSLDPTVRAQYVAQVLAKHPTDATIFVDPDSVRQPSFWELDTTGAWVASPIAPIVAFAHEVSHVLDFTRGDTSVTPNGSVRRVYHHVHLPWGAKLTEYVQAQEWDALSFENSVRRELHLRKRILYRWANQADYTEWKRRLRLGGHLSVDSSRTSQG